MNDQTFAELCAELGRTKAEVEAWREQCRDAERRLLASQTEVEALRTRLEEAILAARRKSFGERTAP